MNSFCTFRMNGVTRCLVYYKPRVMRVLCNNQMGRAGLTPILQGISLER